MKEVVNMTKTEGILFCSECKEALQELYPNYHMTEVICNILNDIITNQSYNGTKIRRLLILTNFYTKTNYPSWWGGWFNIAINHIKRMIELLPNEEEELMPF